MRSVVAFVAFAALIALVSAQQRGGGSCPIPGERPLPCPTYTFTRLGERTSERTYDAFTIVEVVEETFNVVRAIGEAFPALEGYLHGGNANKTDLGERRIPIVVGVEPRIRQNVSTSFIVAEAFTHRAPAPDSPRLRVRSTPQGLRVYSHEFFGGFFADDGPVFEAVRNLVRDLDAQRPPRRFVEGVFFFADYDPLTVRADRRYEVWLIAEGEDFSALSSLARRY